MAISEKEWKAFKKIKAKAVDQFCQSVLDETTLLCTQPDKTTHERYLEVWGLIQKRNREMSQIFDGHSRSKAIVQLRMMRQMGLVNDDELQVFDAEYL